VGLKLKGHICADRSLAVPVSSLDDWGGRRSSSLSLHTRHSQ